MRDRSRRRSIDWLDPDATRRRELRRFVGWSAAAHVLVLGALAWSPAPGAPKLPGVVTVDLVAMAAPAGAPATARSARSTSPRAPARPRTAEAPKPVPKPEPPKPAPKPEPPRREAALPKPQPAPEPKKPRERAQADPKPEPKPEPKPRTPAAKQPAKPEPTRAEKPPPAQQKPEPAKPPREEEAYDDVLAELRAERGESRPGRAAVATPSAGVAGATGVAGASARGAGQPLDAEVAFWLRAAKLHVESAWIVPPGTQRAALRTVVSVRLDEGGRVLGAPRVTERSANPWYDESVVRAIQKASPLPPPPESGEWRFEFTPPGSAG